MNNKLSSYIEGTIVILSFLLPLGYILCKNLIDAIRSIEDANEDEKKYIKNIRYFFYGSDLTLFSLVINGIGLVVIVALLLNSEQTPFKIIWIIARGIIIAMFVCEFSLLSRTLNYRKDWDDYPNIAKKSLIVIVVYYPFLVGFSFVVKNIVLFMMFIVVVLHILIWAMFSIKYSPLTSLLKLRKKDP